jgi:hypothetical protein
MRLALTFNQVVVGSIPTGLTNTFNGLSDFCVPHDRTAERGRNNHMSPATSDYGFSAQELPTSSDGWGRTSGQ